jgi:AraC-like DNA-binding protein
MASQKLLIKNMVCHRCVLAVQDILDREQVKYHKVLVGEIELAEPLTAAKQDRLQEKFHHIGFEVIDTQMNMLIEKIRQLVIKRARNEDGEEANKKKLSYYLSDKLNHEYTYLSSLFSSVEGRTIENYFIEQRIEKAKELLIYDQHTLSQIAFELEYSSVAHLSNQFKKVTGLTPSYFKQVGSERRKAIDEV